MRTVLVFALLAVAATGASCTGRHSQTARRHHSRKGASADAAKATVGTDVATPGDTVSFDEDVPLAARLSPPVVLIRPSSEPESTPRAWKLDASVRSATPPGEDPVAAVSFVVPQLPAGTYTAWFTRLPTAPAAGGQSKDLTIKPALTADRVIALPTVLPYLVTTTRIHVRRAGPAAGPPPATAGGTTPAVLPLDVTLVNSEDRMQHNADLADGQAGTVQMPGGGDALFTITPKFAGPSTFTATATGMDPLRVFVTVRDPGDIDTSTLFRFHGAATAHIGSASVEITTDPFVITAELSFDRRHILLTDVPTDLGPGTYNAGYKIAVLGHPTGTVSRTNDFHIPMQLRYSGELTIGGERVCCDPSVVGIDLTTDAVRSPSGALTDAGRPPVPPAGCPAACFVSIVLVGAGRFTGGMLGDRDYSIRIPASFEPWDKMQRRITVG